MKRKTAVYIVFGAVVGVVAAVIGLVSMNELAMASAVAALILIPFGIIAYIYVRGLSFPTYSIWHWLKTGKARTDHG
jgi:heme O synthase-like polyprenyltransferase